MANFKCGRDKKVIFQPGRRLEKHFLEAFFFFKWMCEINLKYLGLNIHAGYQTIWITLQKLLEILRRFRIEFHILKK